jgi:hypothetical protein
MGDGHILYQGRATEAKDYFANTGFKMHAHSNPADFFMKVLTFNYPKTEEDHNKLEVLNANYAKVLEQEVFESNKSIRCPEVDVSPNSRLMASFRTQFNMLMYRNKAIVKREPQAVRSKIYSCLVFGFLEVSLFWH